MTNRDLLPHDPEMVPPRPARPHRKVNLTTPRRTTKRLLVLIELDCWEGHHEAVVRSVLSAAGKSLRVLEVWDE